MLCKKVLTLLSDYFDGVLEADVSVQVSQHLGQCLHCRKEFDSISTLHNRLSTLGKVQTPEFLYSLVHHRLSQAPLRARMRNELARYWSIIRTTEGMWYATRAVGTVMASIFFIMISSAITPLDIRADAPVNTTGWASLRTEVGFSVLQRLGVQQALLKAVGRSDPAAISELYLLNYGLSVSDAGKDDLFSVAYTVDKGGAAKLDTVIEYPSDKALLAQFTEVMTSARCRPASANGRNVKSPIVFTFSKIFVSD